MGGGNGGGTGGGGGATVVMFDDAGMSTSCLAGYVPPTGQACTSECARGFECVGGVCVLRGQSGDVQVTLRFDQEEDLDLHVVEPYPDGGSCDIYYGNPGQNPNGASPPFDPCASPLGGLLCANKCDTAGWLDLDAYAACNPSNVMVENIIYPAGQPAPKGTYTVRVEYYAACTPSYPVPYEVEVRANGQRRYYCGTFGPNASHGGNAGAGTTVATFALQ